MADWYERSGLDDLRVDDRVSRVNVTPSGDEKLIGAFVPAAVAAAVVVVAAFNVQICERIFLQDNDVVVFIVRRRCRRRAFLSSMERRLCASGVTIFFNVGEQILLRKVVLKWECNYFNFGAFKSGKHYQL